MYPVLDNFVALFYPTIINFMGLRTLISFGLIYPPPPPPLLYLYIYDNY